MNILILLPMIVLFSMPLDNIHKKFKDMGITEVRYSFHDSSVPPPYHRSYTITLTADTIHIVVDSYGDIIADTSFSSSADQLNSVIDLLDEAKIKNCQQTESKGCTGGTGESIQCIKGNESVFSGTAYYCGGQTTGNLLGQVSDIKARMISYIPDFQKILDRK